MKIEQDGDSYFVTIPRVTWKEMRDIVDWIDQTDLMAVIFLNGGGVIWMRGRAEAIIRKGLSIQLFSEEDAVLFRLKWAGAVGRTSQAD